MRKNNTKSLEKCCICTRQNFNSNEVLALDSVSICYDCLKHNKHFLILENNFFKNGFRVNIQTYCAQCPNLLSTFYFATASNANYLCCQHNVVPKHAKHVLVQLHKHKVCIMNPSINAEKMECNLADWCLLEPKLEQKMLNGTVVVEAMKLGKEIYSGTLVNMVRHGRCDVQLPKHVTVQSFSTVYNEGVQASTSEDVVKYKGGSIYRGYLINDYIRHGYGTFTISDIAYSCTWVNDKPKDGKLKYSDGDFYEGSLKCHNCVWYPDGTGTMKYLNGSQNQYY